jgi:glucosamine--fructose-6-phosphate aminotransferase (isomerizing)
MLHFYLLARALSGVDPGIDRIPALAASALELRGEIEQLVERYVFMENCVVVGRGMNYGNAYELALKLMETCYVVAERFSTADFFHGPLAIVERRFPAIMFAPSGVTKKSSLELLARLSELHADCLAITNDAEIGAAASRSIRVADGLDEFLTPIPFIIPAQLFAAHLSAAKGLNPDAPRSLKKVTTTV